MVNSCHIDLPCLWTRSISISLWVNIVAYYSTQIFIDSGFSRSNALWVSLGTGVVNWLFAIPERVDRVDRRDGEKPVDHARAQRHPQRV
jgi:hypothetical protein